MIYLDNNSTTAPDPHLFGAVEDVCRHYYANPQSPHAMGFAASEVLKNDRQAVANVLGCNPTQVIFTSGGTEANTLALHNFVQNEYEILALNTEHSSVINWAEDHIRVLEDGTVNLAALEKKLQAAENISVKIVVTMMLANNETGVLSDPLHRVPELCKQYGALLHIDAVQGFGKIDLKPYVKYADTLSISGHKAHAFKGVGALYIADPSMFEPVFRGGSHEGGIRPGTQNQIGIHSLGYIATHIDERDWKRMRQLRDRLEANLADISEVNGSKEHRLPNTANLYFPKINDLDLFIEQLSQRELYVSGKSACNSGMSKVSRVLTNMYGLTSPRLEGSIRLSVSKFTIEKEIDTAAQIIRDIVQAQ